MTNFKYIKNDSDPWILAEEIPNISFFFCQLWLSSFVNQLENSCGKNYKKVIAVFHGTDMSFYYGEKDSREFEEYLVDKIFANYQFGEKINENIYLHSNNLTNYSRRLSQLNLAKLSNNQLHNLIQEHDKIHTKLYEWGWLSNATDMFHGTFTNRMKKYLSRFARDDESLNQYLMILSTPNQKSVFNKQEEEWLKIIVEIQKNHPKIQKISQKMLRKSEKELLQKYWQKYHHVKFLWIGKDGTYSIGDYIKQINEFLASKMNALEIIKRTNQEFRQKLKQKRKLIRKLGIDKKYQQLFSVYSEFMLTKAYRREAQIYWSYQFHKLLKGISKRLDLSLKQTYFIHVDEMKSALLKNQVNRKLLSERATFCIYYAEKGKDQIFTGKDAEEIEKTIQKTSHKGIKEFKGQVACTGMAKGEVKIINDPTQLSKMNKGDILVSTATNPDIVPAMKKAGAIVTEQGGITSHAAIVSRELNIPCVIGTKIATKVLKDGDLVEVDANKGIVLRLTQDK